MSGTRGATLLIALSLALTGCGSGTSDPAGSDGAWFVGPDANRQVFCMRSATGSFSCDWVGYHKADQ